MAKILGNQDSAIVQFLDQQSKKAETTESKPTPEPVKPELKPTKASKLQDFNNIMDSKNPEKSILAAGTGVTDLSGGKRYLGDSGNSIFDSEKLKRAFETGKDNREKTTETKQRVKDLRSNMRKDRMDEMIESMQGTDTRSASSVSSLSPSSDENTYRVPRNENSIFGSGNFDNVPEKTDGEKVAEAARTPKEKDTSWKERKGTMRTSGMTSKLMDQLMGEE